MDHQFNGAFDAREAEPRQLPATVSAAEGAAIYARAGIGGVVPIPQAEPGQSPSTASPWHAASLPFFIASQFADLPIPRQAWQVPNWIVAGAVNLLYGDGGTGKSLLALQLAVATACGLEWLGMPVQQGPVLYLSAEDEPAEIHRRLDRIVRARGRSLADLGYLGIINAAGLDVVLAIPNATDGQLKETERFKQLRTQIASFDPKPCLLILDNLADVFGGDEIKKVQARQFITMLRKLAVEFNMTILLLAHPSQAGMESGRGTSGNTAWSNSVRSRLYFKRIMSKDGVEANPNIRALEVMKSNYAAKGEAIRVSFNEGVFESMNGSEVNVVDGKIDAAFLNMLKQYNSKERWVSLAKTSPYYAPKTFANDKVTNKNGFSKEQSEHAMERLINSGQIDNEKYGSPSDKTRRLVIATQSLIGEAQ